ncbi:hypothetical conserved protein [Candidatus Nitrosoglobus terrae]|uniref:Hypothetical conserved protein n=1 Tax=Candidatus Nitrosoglobus terrae TaxID=1630141 RepID=A0A1Q2SM57_9GAMM|nr:sulfotransferase family 2 domain-containing protein [Candidatus Nitrosoglobus terrae]BAW80179.1 hypothetical conserved protein [Candidatus Nitrosoglobus terrae]
MIGIKHQFIFVHIPKTAGNTLQSILSPYSEDSIVASSNKDGIHRFGLSSAYGTTKHATLSEYFSALGAQLFWSMKKFTCIRNPWERAISFYFSPHRGHRIWDRNTFVQELDKIQSMVSFLQLSNEGNPDKNLNFIIRYEQLNQDFCRLCNDLGFEKKNLPILNKGNRQPYVSYYDSGLIQMVADRFAADIKLFGYEFSSQ